MTELYQTLGEEPAPKTLFLCMGNNVRCPQPQRQWGVRLSQDGAGGDGA